MTKRVYIFDVDGTLTPARQPATQEFLTFFEDWAKEHTFYLCSGSDLEKIEEQLPSEILSLSEGIFACMGNAFYKDNKKVYQRDFNPPVGFEKFLEFQLRFSHYPFKTGNHIEKRIGMWNFSIVGRNATLQERKEYYTWDIMSRERLDLVKKIEQAFPEVSAVAGGEISLDLNNPGRDKSQVAEEVLKLHPDAVLVFIGDRTHPGGNDYALSKKIIDDGLGVSVQTRGWKETIKILNFMTQLNNLELVAKKQKEKLCMMKN
jgi:phosphomannomutase